MFQNHSIGVSVDFHVSENTITVNILETVASGVVQFDFVFDVAGDEYVLFPACCYKGNQFDVLKKPYPPLFTPQEASPDMPVTITDVPRLHKDGSGHIEVTTGDVSTPCMGVFSRQKSVGMLLFTIQEIGGINLGLCYSRGRMSLTYPHNRPHDMYRWPFMTPAHEEGISFTKGSRIEIPYRLVCFPCHSMEQFFRMYFENRKCINLDCTRPAVLPFAKQFEIQRDKFNRMNWRESGGFYGVTTLGEACAWQPGWVGGGMSSYALMKGGGSLEQHRALRTLYHVFSTQTPSGFLCESADDNGTPGQTFFPQANRHWVALRKSADVLYFLFKYFSLMQERNLEIPDLFVAGTRKLADAFVTLWKRYGQFGQFADQMTGDIVAGGSTAAAIAPAGLVYAWRFWGEKRYLDTAKAAAEQYYTRDAQAGYTTGGPSEILQCPDSESAFALLESLVVLYEETREEVWLARARHVAHLCSSWVVSYNYRFPPNSEFGRLGMKTVGSVFANVQNKHAAPGICTLSGDSLHKLYRWTGDGLYLELLKDIALTISQYISTDERPIYSWDVPKDASLLNDDSLRVPPEKLPQGFICERVNMSDWESRRCVGGVFNGSCWPETSNLLTLVEVVDLLEIDSMVVEQKR